jgi:hypothetical protein
MATVSFFKTRIAKMQDISGIGEIVNSKIAENIYEDTASGALKEVGKIGADLAKTARLFLAPFQVTALFQTRFEKYLKSLEGRVPEECRIEVHPQISGPALESMRYIDETEVLWSMFCELLSKAADSRNVQYVHPSFVHILKQLTRDEVLLLSKLYDEPFLQTDTLELNREKNEWQNKETVDTTIPYGELHNPESFRIYYSHLESLSLITWPITKEQAIYEHEEGLQTGIRQTSNIALTEFGKLFVDACTIRSEPNQKSP